MKVFRERLVSGEGDDWISGVTTEWLSRNGPAIPDDPAAVRWYKSYPMRGASSGANTAIRLMNA